MFTFTHVGYDPDRQTVDARLSDSELGGGRRRHSARVAVICHGPIRPHDETQKQERERKDMLSRLKRGDTVITSGGLIGKIDAVNPSEIKVEIADKVRVRVAREDVDLYMTSESEK